ncbi:hypothetical protein CsSME_00020815 [Camellia sinensis var. sinensis]
MKELRTGTTLLRGHTKDGVYEWPTSSPLIAFSTIKTTSFDWHHRLRHPSFPIATQKGQFTTRVARLGAGFLWPAYAVATGARHSAASDAFSVGARHPTGPTGRVSAACIVYYTFEATGARASTAKVTGN